MVFEDCFRCIVLLLVLEGSVFGWFVFLCYIEWLGKMKDFSLVLLLFGKVLLFDDYGVYVYLG